MLINRELDFTSTTSNASPPDKLQLHLVTSNEYVSDDVFNIHIYLILG